MKKQLTSALKKSISAEKTAVATKKPTVNTTEKQVSSEEVEVKQVIKNIKQTSQKPTPAKKLASPEVTTQEEAQIEAPVMKPEIITPVKHRLSNETPVQNALNFNHLPDFSNFAAKQQELITTTLETITEFQQDVASYMNEFSQVRDINQLTKLNMAFLTQISAKQKLFFEEVLAKFMNK